MKLAISGKGGVGKSTIAAVLALLISRHGRRVLAVDADPDANLAAALGIPEQKRERIVPLSQQVALIEERTGAKVKQYGQIFKLNPDVSDIADKFATPHENVSLLVLGAVEQGGSGCACPENILIRALITDLVLYKEEALIMDMEAGIEHLGRATAKGVETILIAVEPGRRSVDCARRIIRMSEEIGIRNIRLLANKVTGTDDEEFVRNAFPDSSLLGVIPYSEDIRLADRDGRSPLDGMNSALTERFENILNQLS
ncbi:MAG: AAA family ATPase [Proteobacteria bacterium]|nr:AAA family ATPase [Pseudomonadota bacterium]